MGPEAKSSFVTYPRLSKFKQQSQDSNPDFFFWESLTLSIEKSLRGCIFLNGFSFI